MRVKMSWSVTKIAIVTTLSIIGLIGAGILAWTLKRLYYPRMLSPEEKVIINSDPVEETDDRCQDPVTLSKNIFRQLLQLKGKHMREDGSGQYFKMKEDPDFAKVAKDTSYLKCVDLAAMKPDEQKAFFINTYNSLTIHALTLLVEEGNTKTLLGLDNFWQKNAYNISTFVFSLDDMEHGVLRGNKLHPTYKDYFFKEGDPRRDFVQKTLDHRIHFALNCGAASCPPIRLYTAENLDKGLTLAAQNFCQNSTEIRQETKEVVLSKLLDWYGTDFGSSKEDVLKTITQYLTDEQKSALEAIGSEVKISFASYDWSIH